MKQGWISVHRQIREHWLWEDKPFSKGQAWIDLLMLASHTDNKFLLGNELVEVKTGSFITSIEKLRKKWGWSNTKVVSFLNLLESDGMITKKSDTKKTAITIENYSFYQLCDETETMQKRCVNDTKTIRKHTINNDNNENKYKDIIDYLNEKTGKKFKASTPKTKTSINARLAEGFTIEDFKTVIDKKTAEWKDDKKMNQYLRPETLFGTKFEGYLNANAKSKPVSNEIEDDPLEGLF